MPRAARSSSSTSKRSRAPEAPHTGEPQGAASPSKGNGAPKTSEVNGMPGWAAQVRLPLSWSLQTLMLMLHAGEEWQRAQLDCWHLALKRHEQAHQRLLGCEDTAAMASVHADILRFDTANLTQLGQRCMDTGVHLNTDLARLIAQALDGTRHHAMRSAFEGFQSGLHTGIRPLDDIFNAPILRELAAATGMRPAAAPVPGRAEA